MLWSSGAARGQGQGQARLVPMAGSVSLDAFLRAELPHAAITIISAITTITTTTVSCVGHHPPCSWVKK